MRRGLRRLSRDPGPGGGFYFFSSASRQPGFQQRGGRGLSLPSGLGGSQCPQYRRARRRWPRLSPGSGSVCRCFQPFCPPLVRGNQGLTSLQPSLRGLGLLSPWGAGGGKSHSLVWEPLWRETLVTSDGVSVRDLPMDLRYVYTRAEGVW